MFGWVMVFLIIVVSMAAILLLPYLILRDRKKIRESASGKNSIVWKRRWFQWVLAIPFLILSLFALLNPLPKGFALVQGMTQVEMLTAYISVLGHWLPGLACFYLSYFCLRKYAVKSTATTNE